MRLLALRLELKFAEEFKSHSTSQQIYKELTGRIPYSIKMPEEPGVIIRSLKKKQLVYWDSTLCRVVMESVVYPNECLEEMLSLLETINRIAPIGRLSKREFVTFWLLPAENYDFKSLEQKYRDNLVIPQPLWENIYDSSVLADMEVNGSTFHHQSGAMQVPQLMASYLEFKLSSVPRTFLFLWASIINKRMVKYSMRGIRRFLHTSLQQCEHHSKLFEDSWRGKL